MEKKLKMLNDIINKANVKMMILALINHSLGSKIGTNEELISQIMAEENVQLTPDEVDVVVERMITALNQYIDIGARKFQKEKKYDKLMICISSELSKETTLMTKIQSDVFDRYDTSLMSFETLGDTCCWLTVKSAIELLPGMNDTLKAANSYKNKTKANVGLIQTDNDKNEPLGRNTTLAIKEKEEIDKNNRYSLKKSQIIQDVIPEITKTTQQKTTNKSVTAKSNKKNKTKEPPRQKKSTSASFNMFQISSLKRAVVNRDYSATTMHSIFG